MQSWLKKEKQTKTLQSELICITTKIQTINQSILLMVAENQVSVS